jgi:peroxiredoxin
MKKHIPQEFHRSRRVAQLSYITSLAIICLFFLLVSCDRQAQRPQNAAIGKLAPGFNLVDRQGKTWDLEELKGQVVFVNFWATWCAPCREEMPSMQKLYTSLPSNKFKMLAILSNDEPAFADQVVKKMGVTFPILIDPDKTASKAYGITGVPETYIVDKQGVLRERFLGPVAWDSREARQMLQKYLEMP